MHYFCKKKDLGPPAMECNVHFIHFQWDCLWSNCDSCQRIWWQLSPQICPAAEAEPSSASVLPITRLSDVAPKQHSRPHDLTLHKSACYVNQMRTWLLTLKHCTGCWFFPSVDVEQMTYRLESTVLKWGFCLRYPSIRRAFPCVTSWWDPSSYDGFMDFGTLLFMCGDVC